MSKIFVLNVIFLSLVATPPNSNSEDDDSNSNDEDEDAGVPRRRGSIAGTKRGKYNKKATQSVKRRIIEAANEQKDWRILAEALGIKIPTARAWISKGTPTMKPMGGTRNTILLPEHEESIRTWIEENVSITLREIVDKLKTVHNISVCRSTVDNHLHNMLFTVKKVNNEREQMNIEINKQKRRDYVQRILEINGEVDSVIVFIDETNFNLYTKRQYGRSSKGKKAVSRDPSSKGPNIHVIGGISTNGLEFWESRRGSFKKAQAEDWMKRLIRTMVNRGTNVQDIVLVIDNAPCHSDIERILNEDEFNLVRIIRLAPYSAPLNPIEAAWSMMKEKFKELHGVRKGSYV